MPLKKQSLIDQVEAALAAEIVTGKWPDVLPGLRTLAHELEVSVPTLSEAIDRLVSKGILSSQGGRKRFRIQNSRAGIQSNLKSSERVLIITTPGGVSAMNKATANVVQGISRDMNRRGWLVNYAEVDFFDAKSTRRKWDDLIAGNKVSLIIIVFGREVIGKWALSTGLPVCFLGGNAGDLPIPVIAVDISKVVEDALEKLIRLGHRNFFIPLGVIHPTLVAKMHAAYSVALSKHGLNFNQTIQMPVSTTRNPETVWRAMDRAWEQSEKPTALIFLDWNTCVTGTSYLAAKGLRIPDDISVVILANENSTEWFRPHLAHYTFPENDFIKAVSAWTQSKGYNRDKLLQHMLKTFNPGKSLAPLKRLSEVRS